MKRWNESKWNRNIILGTHQHEIFVLLIIRIGVSSDTQIDLEIGKRSLQLRSESVVRVSRSSIQIRWARHDLKIGIDMSVSINQMSAKRESGPDILKLKLCRTFKIKRARFVSLMRTNKISDVPNIFLISENERKCNQHGRVYLASRKRCYSRNRRLYYAR